MKMKRNGTFFMILNGKLPHIALKFSVENRNWGRCMKKRMENFLFIIIIEKGCPELGRWIVRDVVQKTMPWKGGLASYSIPKKNKK
jgi:hypothetical protein